MELLGEIVSIIILILIIMILVMDKRFKEEFKQEESPKQKKILRDLVIVIGVILYAIIIMDSIINICVDINDMSKGSSNIETTVINEV